MDVSPRTTQTTAGRALRPAPATLLLAAATLVSCDPGSGPEVLRPAALGLVSGQGQSAEVGSPLAEPLVVRVTDERGQPVPGTPVVWTVVAGGGSLASASATGGDGTASGTLTVGTKVGTNTVAAGVAGLPSVTFDAAAKVGAPATLRRVSGDGQSAPVGTPLPAPLVVSLVDRYDNPTPGWSVEWIVSAGQGTANPPTSITDTVGLARTQWTLAGPAGAKAMVVRAPGGATATFNATALPATVESVVVTPTEASMAPGKTVQLAAVPRDAHGNVIAGRSVAWSSGAASVATVDSAGRVTGVALGTTTISARIDGKTGTAAIRVEATRPEAYTRQSGMVTSSMLRLYGSVVPNGSPTRVWFRYGLDPQLSTFTETKAFGPWAQNTGVGQVVSGLSPSTTYYYALWAENALGQASGGIVEVRTSPAVGTRILTEAGLSGASASSYTTRFALPAGTSRVEVLASGGNGDVDLFVRHGAAAQRDDADCYSAFEPSTIEFCTVDEPADGTWHVLLWGRTSYAGVTLSVTSYPAAAGVGVVVSPASATLSVGSVRQLSATVTGSSNTAVTWSSSNASVAAVDPNGLVTAVAAGEARVRATSQADPAKSAEAVITVTPQAVRYTLTIAKAGNGSGSVSSSPSGPTYDAGTSVTLTAAADMGSRFAGWSGACGGAATTCVVTMSADRGVTATFDVAAGVSVWDGTYVGRYVGRFAGMDVSDVVIFRVSGGAITVVLPGAGTGTVDAAGATTFTGGLGVAGVECTYQGRFTQVTGGGAAANGDWACQGGGDTGSGTWAAVRQSESGGFLPGGVWINASWSWGRTSTPETRKAVTDPALTLGNFCPESSVILDKVFADATQQTARVRASVLCASPPTVYSCVAKGSETQPAQGAGGGEPLRQCATDPLETPPTSLRQDALAFTGPGVVQGLYLTHPALNLNVFYCRPGTTLVGPPRALRLQCI